MRTNSRSIAIRSWAVAAAVGLALAGLPTVAHAAPAAAAPATAPVAGVGHGTSTRVDTRTLPRAAKETARTLPGAAPRRGSVALPARPRGTGKTVPAAARTAPGGPNTMPAGRVIGPLVAPAVVSNFDGLDQAAGCGGCQPPDPNAAVSNTQILNAANVAMRATTKAGAVLCSFRISTFLNTTDSLSDPRVQFDNVNNRFSFTITVVPASNTAAPALWVAASTSDNACGSWFIYRVTFAGGSFPPGTLLDYPMLGQDRNALLFGTDNFTPTSRNATVFGIPKAAVYAGAGFSFSAFNTASLSAPVSNAGIPMISTPFSYFLASVPGTGYRLYRLTNSGGAGATLTLQATISSPFNAPGPVDQPGSPSKLDALDGRIVWSPANDGAFIWFAHGIDLAGFPAVRYGAISISSNTATVAVAFRNGTSDDFNPSIGIGIAPGGGDYIFLNWAYTDTVNNVAVSDTVDSVPPGGGVPNLIGTGAVLVAGSPTTQTRFGDYSSVSIDPSVPGGSCAVTAQEYFAPGGSWRTRIARVGIC